jgi:hypothetical protein
MAVQSSEPHLVPNFLALSSTCQSMYVRRCLLRTSFAIQGLGDLASLILSLRHQVLLFRVNCSYFLLLQASRSSIEPVIHLNRILSDSDFAAARKGVLPLCCASVSFATSSAP